MSITVTSFPLGTMDNLIHCLIDTSSQTCMVVDPAWDCAAIERHVAKHGVDIIGILLTHSHYDHISALDELLEKHPVPVYLSDTEYQLGNLNLDHYISISDGDQISLGSELISVIATPGHTTGSVCFATPNDLIAGDTLFIDGCGRCNFPESDVSAMWHSLQKLKALPDHIMVHTGHHYGQCQTDTIGNQKHTNPYLLIDNQAFFTAFRMHLQSHYRSIPFQPSSQEEMQHIQQQHAQSLNR